MDPEKYLKIGEIYREHGVKGLCKVTVYSGTDENLHIGDSYWLLSPRGLRKKGKIKTIKVLGRHFLIGFDVFTKPEDIISWRKSGLWLERTKVVRHDGAAYDFEFEGMTILNEKAEILGRVLRMIYTPLRQFCVETKDGQEVLIPFVPEWILKEDREKKSITMKIPEGLV
jgi:16S rRNA processing protein RimM